MATKSPLLMSTSETPAKKHKVPKILGEPAAKGGPHSQVGELGQEMEEPTPAMRIKRSAMDEKVHATRKWIAGELTNKQHDQAHRRANHAIKNARKLGK